MALNQKVSWTSLKTFLKELISSFESSKQLNEVLLEELQLLHSNQTESKSIEKETGEDENEVLSEKEYVAKEEIAKKDQEQIQVIDNEDVNLDKSVTEKDCSNETVQTEFYETPIEEDMEDITNDDFTIENEENKPISSQKKSSHFQNKM